MIRKDMGMEYWDKRAEDFFESRKTNDYEYGRKVLRILELDGVIDSNSEVLDIGAGPGTFIIPFARKVKKITAIEPSKRMVEIIKNVAKEEGIENFEIINKTWEEVDIFKITKKYDLVICSFTSWIFKDVWEQLKRMEQVSKAYCCIIEGVGDWDEREQKLWYKVMGKIKKPNYSTYPLIYNILYNKGRLPNVKIISYVSERSVENKIRHRKLFFQKYIEITPVIEDIIKNHVLEYSKDGRYKEEGKAAVIWWNVYEVGEEP